MELINFKDGKFINDNYMSTDEILENLAKKRHPVYEEFVGAVSQMWKDLGLSQKYCVPCFQGTGPHSYSKEVHGCCHTCPHLGADGCVAKPLGCALYFCWPRGMWDTPVYKFLTGLKSTIQTTLYNEVKYNWASYYAWGYRGELNQKWTPRQLALFMGLTRLIKRRTKRFLATNPA